MGIITLVKLVTLVMACLVDNDTLIVPAKAQRLRLHPLRRYDFDMQVMSNELVSLLILPSQVWS